ncbi:hypothetical protein [Bacillus alkalicellulosilyticus]|uniref:hypothetical protein n=1 Tax=Alkalihalobacterium alkalicellulosilyticum TaxID=1912214 RepID=UPI0009967012|nr:hypothetical protein [Bacillus alkalicellulosilyticus]
MKLFITAILSVPLFAIITTFYFFNGFKQDYSVELVILIVTYIGPIIFLVNLVFSLMIELCIDILNSKLNWAKYIIGLGLYSVCGIIIGIAIGLVFLYELDIILYGISGFILYICYFHLSLLISKISWVNPSSLVS